MEQSRHIRLYGLHSWTGVILGLFLYAISITGCFALFHKEIALWAEPDLTRGETRDPIGFHSTFADWVGKTAGTDDIELIELSLPHDLHPYYSAIMWVGGSEGIRREEAARWNAATGEKLSAPNSQLANWLLRFHRELMWPSLLGGEDLGRTIIGIGGIVMMLSILSGFLIHGKRLKGLFTLRLKRSTRLKWQDMHKAMGLWGLPFFAMTSITGAFLGTSVLLAPLIGVLAFKGDIEALSDAVVRPAQIAAGMPAALYSIDDARNLPHPGNGTAPFRMVITNWGDMNARYELQYDAPRTLALDTRLLLDGVTGKQLAASGPSGASTAARTIDMMAPLHFGTFGGVPLKIIYLLLGLALCLMIALGLMTWLERKKASHKGDALPVAHGRMAKLIGGVIFGLPIAGIGLFYVERLSMVTGSGLGLGKLSTAYFTILAMSLGYCFLKADTEQAIRRLAGLTGLLFVSLPVLNAVNGDMFLRHLLHRTNLIAAYVDLGALLIGGVIIACAWKTFAQSEKRANAAA